MRTGGLFVLAAAGLFIFALRLGPRGETPAGRPPAAPPAGAEAQTVERFTLEGFDPTGERSWALEGQSARITGATNVFIEKKAVLRIRSSTVVRTDRVYWNNSNLSFFTKSPVRINHEGQTIEGVGAFGKAGEEFLQINRDIRLRLRDAVTLKARGPLKFFHQRNRAFFYRDVQIEDAKGSVHADELEVAFDPETGEIHELIAKRNVTIRRGGDLSRSDVAVYDTRTQSVRLAGGPEILLEHGTVESAGREPDGAS